MSTPTSSPTRRSDWSVLETLDLIVGAIEYLKTLIARGNVSAYFTGFWGHWVGVHGDLDETFRYLHHVPNRQVHVAQYRRRVFKTLRWFAVQGRRSNHPRPHQASIARLRAQLIAIVGNFSIMGVSSEHWAFACWAVHYQGGGNTEGLVLGPYRPFED